MARTAPEGSRLTSAAWPAPSLVLSAFIIVVISASASFWSLGSSVVVTTRSRSLKLT